MSILDGVNDIESFAGNTVNMSVASNTPFTPAWPEIVEYGDLTGLQWYEFEHELSPDYEYMIEYTNVQHTGTKSYVGIQFKTSAVVKWHNYTVSYTNTGKSLASEATTGLVTNRVCCSYYYINYAGGTFDALSDWRLSGRAWISNHADNTLSTLVYQHCRINNVTTHNTYHGTSVTTVSSTDAHKCVRFANADTEFGTDTFLSGYVTLHRQRTLTA